MGLIFDGVDIEAEYGIVVDGADTWAKPERDREAVHVPGRSGDLIHDNGSWHNVEIEYHCLIEHGFADRFDAFCDWLYAHLGYYRFEDQLRHPGVYRMAEFYGPLDPDTIFRDHAGKFDLKFNCKPQQWLTSGEEAVDLTYMAWVDGYYSSRAFTPSQPEDPTDPRSFFEVGDFVLSHDIHQGIATPLLDTSEVNGTYIKVVNNASRSIAAYVAQVQYDENMQVITNYDTLNYHTLKSYVVRTTLAPGENLELGAYNPEEAYRRYSVRSSHFTNLSVYYGFWREEANEIEWHAYVESSELIRNETNYPSRPIIEIDNPEGVRFQVNDYEVSVGETTASTLIIDCELEDCYSYDSGGNVVNENGNVSIECSNPRELSDFPYIVPGENFFQTLLGETTIRDSDELTAAIRIHPNWYRI